MPLRELHTRTFPGDLCVRESTFDGEPEVFGLVVPYGETATIIEPRPDGVITYREQFVPGAFERAMRNPHRVTLTYGHSESMSDRMGHGRQFAETADGLVGAFRIDPARAEQVRDIVTTSHRGLSVGFISLAPPAHSEMPGRLITRKAVHLAHVAAVPIGAYMAATVSQVRSDDIDPDPSPAELEEQQRREADAQLLADIEALKAAGEQWNALLRS